MSASTRTIQRPMGQGSILGAIAIGLATLFVIGAVAWLLNASATKPAARTVVSSTYVGSGMPVPTAVPNTDPSSISGRLAPAAAPAPLPTFDIDSAHAVPYVDRFAPIQPETPFDRAHRAPYVGPTTDDSAAKPLILRRHGK